MATRIVLNAPVPTTSYHLRELRLNMDAALIAIRLRSDTGHEVRHRIHGQRATDLMVALNTANLTLKPLEVRALEIAIADGVLDGSIVTE